MKDTVDTRDGDVKRRLDELDARLIEQEHRTVHVALNAYKYFDRDTVPEKRTAAMRALFWRVFAPYTAAAVLAGGGSLVAGLTAYFLYQQNQKLDAQTKLIERQTEIVAGEGLWENLWNAHYAENPEVRMNAAVEVASRGHVLRGVILEGVAPPDSRFVHLREKPRFDDGQFDATAALVTVPGRLTKAIEPQTFRTLSSTVAGHIERAEVRNLEVDLFELTKLEVRGLSFIQSLVDLTARKRSARLCIECSFTSSEIRVQEGRVSFEASYFRDARISSGSGEVFIRNSKFDVLVWSGTWGRDQIRDSDGYALVADYHGWSGEDARPTFENSSIEHLLFRWDDREMSDVESFLRRTVHSTANIGRFYFVREEVVDGSARLVILREPSARANAWNSTRR